MQIPYPFDCLINFSWYYNYYYFTSLTLMLNFHFIMDIISVWNPSVQTFLELRGWPKWGSLVIWWLVPHLDYPHLDLTGLIFRQRKPDLSTASPDPECEASDSGAPCGVMLLFHCILWFTYLNELRPMFLLENLHICMAFWLTLKLSVYSEFLRL